MVSSIYEASDLKRGALRFALPPANHYSRDYFRVDAIGSSQSTVLTIELVAIRVEPLEHSWLLAFKLLVALHVLFAKIDRELQVMAAYATIGSDLPDTHSEHAFPH